MDASTLTLPVFEVLGLIGIIASLVVWIYSTFEKKDEAKMRHESLEARVSGHESLLQNVARDVSYIRGRIEIKHDG